jgi:hypothetical protein
MNLYQVYRTDKIGYDEYDAMVVAADSDDEAFRLCDEESGCSGDDYATWAKPDHLLIRIIGTTLPDLEAGVIIASFNAG